MERHHVSSSASHLNNAVTLPAAQRSLNAEIETTLRLVARGPRTSPGSRQSQLHSKMFRNIANHNVPHVTTINGHRKTAHPQATPAKREPPPGRELEPRCSNGSPQLCRLRNDAILAYGSLEDGSPPWARYSHEISFHVYIYIWVHGHPRTPAFLKGDARVNPHRVNRAYSSAPFLFISI